MYKLKNPTLKELRIEKGYNYLQMANKLGISKTFYWQIENHERRLTYELAIEIASIFRKKPDDVFFDEYIEYIEYFNKQ